MCCSSVVRALAAQARHSSIWKMWINRLADHRLRCESGLESCLLLTFVTLSFLFTVSGSNCIQLYVVSPGATDLLPVALFIHCQLRHAGNL